MSTIIIKKYEESEGFRASYILHEPYSSHHSRLPSIFHYLQTNSYVEISELNPETIFYKETGSHLKLKDEDILIDGFIYLKDGKYESVKEFKKLDFIVKDLSCGLENVNNLISNPEILKQLLINKNMIENIDEITKYIPKDNSINIIPDISISYVGTTTSSNVLIYPATQASSKITVKN
jgi:hypothetical protein